MNPQDNNPSSRPPSLYQMSTERERKGGGGGMIVLLLVVLLLAAGGVYYFLKVYRKPLAPVAAALPAAAPTPTPRAAAAPTAVGYNSVTEQSYIDQADKAFMAVQGPKIKTFSDAYAAFKAAGYVNPKGLTSKEAVAARRDLIAKCIAANDDYAAFVAGEEAAYKDNLAQTPLTPADAKSTLDGYVAKAKPADVIKLRQAEHDYLQSCDDMMAALVKWYGNWSLSPAGKLSFKRKENTAEYNEIAQKCNAQAALVAKLQSDYNATFNPDGAVPSPGDGAAPSAADGAAAAPAPSAASPAPAQP